MKELLGKIDKAYFWDIDFATIDVDKSKRLIIERVISLGNLEEIRRIREQWGDDEIRNTICNLNFLDSKTLNFVSLLFNVPITKFRCYTRKQSNPPHWNS